MTKKSKRPAVIDLFAGVGGMSLGLEAAGFDVIASVELDPVHCAVHKFNFPYSQTICSDVNRFGLNSITDAATRRRIKDIDLIIGGPPCQGFSQIGQRQLDDPRNALVYAYCRAIKEFRPKYFIFENVPGIIAGKHKVFVDELINEFSALNYKIVTPRILNAANYGVAQNRSRFIMIGCRNDVPVVDYPMPEHFDNGKENPSLFKGARQIVGAKEALCDLQDIEVFIGEDPGVPPAHLSYTGYRRNYSFNNGGAFKLCHKRTFKKRLVHGHMGSVHTNESIRRFRKTTPGATEAISRFFKLHADRACHTIRAGTASNRGAHTAPRPIHYLHPRCISVREAARLHSYPDWFQFHRTIWHGFREIGNSVAPIFAKQLGDQIIKALAIPPAALKPMVLEMANKRLLQVNMADACELFGIEDSPIAQRRRKHVQ